MDEDSTSKDSLLPQHEKDTSDAPPGSHVGRDSTNTLHSRGILLSFLCISLASVALNIYLLIQNVSSRELYSSNQLPSTLMGSSAYTSLGLDIPVTYYHHTDYWGMNQTRADELWEAIDTNPMVVALSDQWVDAHGLPKSDRWAWDEGKGRYFVKVFHQLHCLKFIRRAFVDYERGKAPTLNGRHVHHCLDTLRKDVTCIADDTLMPTGEEARSIGDGQQLMCRDFGKLVEWIYDPERHACHRALDDYRSITHPLERYAFCPKDSKYYNVMMDYFTENGHVDPWG